MIEYIYEETAGFDDVTCYIKRGVVVRCKNCRYSRPLNRKDAYENAFVDGCIWCVLRQDGVQPDGYCSDGEGKRD